MILPISKNQIHDLKKLQQKKYRRTEKQVLVEGWNLLEQLIANDIIPEAVITCAAEGTWHKLQGLQCPIYSAREHELKALAETETPQTVIAVMKLPQYSIGEYRALIYLDGIQDPGNVGTIFRIAAAFGFDGVVLSDDSCEVFSPKVIRASLGSVFWIPSASVNHTWLPSQTGVEKIGLLGGCKTKLYDLKVENTERLIMVVGSEGNGIKEMTRAELTQEVDIPITGKMESLNAAVAAGIGAYEISRRLFLLT